MTVNELKENSKTQIIIRSNKLIRLNLKHNQIIIKPVYVDTSTVRSQFSFKTRLSSDGTDFARKPVPS